MAQSNFRYKPPESQASDKRTPVNFHGPKKDSFIPGQEEAGEKLFFCMAEMYESSTKDYEAINTTNMKYAMTLIIPNPYPDYKPGMTNYFMVEYPIYEGVEFNIQNVVPHGVQEIKIVGVAYG